MPLKILLADDSMIAQNMGKKILTEAGYDVTTVSNGAAAVRKLPEVKPDIVMLDVYMPGYNGLEVTERVKSSPSTAHVPVLLTVGKLEPFRAEDGLKVKADAVIIKPFEATDLIAVVGKLAERVSRKPSAPAKLRQPLEPEWKDDGEQPEIPPTAINVPNDVAATPAFGDDLLADASAISFSGASATAPTVTAPVAAASSMPGPAIAEVPFGWDMSQSAQSSAASESNVPTQSPAPVAPSLAAGVHESVAGLDLTNFSFTSAVPVESSAAVVHPGGSAEPAFVDTPPLELRIAPAGVPADPQVDFEIEKSSAGEPLTVAPAPGFEPTGLQEKFEVNVAPDPALIPVAEDIPAPVAAVTSSTPDSGSRDFEHAQEAIPEGDGSAEPPEFALFNAVFGSDADGQFEARLSAAMEAYDAASAIPEPRPFSAPVAAPSEQGAANNAAFAPAERNKDQFAVPELPVAPLPDTEQTLSETIVPAAEVAAGGFSTPAPAVVPSELAGEWEPPQEVEPSIAFHIEPVPVAEPGVFQSVPDSLLDSSIEEETATVESHLTQLLVPEPKSGVDNQPAEAMAATAMAGFNQSPRSLTEAPQSAISIDQTPADEATASAFHLALAPADHEMETMPQGPARGLDDVREAHGSAFQPSVPERVEPVMQTQEVENAPEGFHLPPESAPLNITFDPDTSEGDEASGDTVPVPIRFLEAAAVQESAIEPPVVDTAALEAELAALTIDEPMEGILDASSEELSDEEIAAILRPEAPNVTAEPTFETSAPIASAQEIPAVPELSYPLDVEAKAETTVEPEEFKVEPEVDQQREAQAEQPLEPALPEESRGPSLTLSSEPAQSASQADSELNLEASFDSLSAPAPKLVPEPQFDANPAPGFELRLEPKLDLPPESSLAPGTGVDTAPVRSPELESIEHLMAEAKNEDEDKLAEQVVQRVLDRLRPGLVEEVKRLLQRQ